MVTGISDEEVATWVKETNRGVPDWDSLDEEGRNFWRNMFVFAFNKQVKWSGLNSLARECHEISESKGWLEENRTFGDLIALMHSELSEALEEFRAGYSLNEIYYSCVEHDFTEVHTPQCKPEGIPVELADTLIRILQLCGTQKIDIQKAFEIKMAYNKTRPHRHGGKKI